MKKYSAIIIDDEVKARENLRSFLINYFPEIKIAGEAPSVSQAKTIIEKLKPDVVFLDILMPDQDGFDLLDVFPNRKFAVIFVSASLDFGIKALKAGVLDYVLKPLNKEELQSAINKIGPYLNQLESGVKGNDITRLALTHSYGFSIEDINDIVRLEADDNYTRVYTVAGKSYLISRTLKDFEEVLPADKFIRTHKSFIINMNYLKDFSVLDGGMVTLKDGKKVPVSKRKNSTFFSTLKKVSLMLRT